MIHQIHHLHCGSFCPTCAPLFGQKGFRAHLVCHCLLIETDKGLVLVDTGLGLQDYLHPQNRLGRFISRTAQIKFNPQLSAIHQIQKLGFKAQDVQHILLSHLDFDHAGGISDFPQATVHVLASEYNATQNLHSLKSRLRYRPQQFQQHRYWNFIENIGTQAWFNLEHTAGLSIFQEDILMLPLLGHTAGHAGIAIKNNQRWLLYCGDAYYSQHQLNPNFHSRALNQLERLFATDNTQRLHTLHKIQQLAQHPDIDLICAHDPFELARYQNTSNDR